MIDWLNKGIIGRLMCAASWPTTLQRISGSLRLTAAEKAADLLLL